MAGFSMNNLSWRTQNRGELQLDNDYYVHLMFSDHLLQASDKLLLNNEIEMYA